MRSLIQDLRYTLRTLRKAPGFTTLAVLVLALGIGANSAMFTVVNAVGFRPLAGRADELVGLFSRDRTKPDSYRGFSYPNYTDVRDRQDVFDELMAHAFSMVGIAQGDGTRRAFASVVSSNYFATLGVSLAAGRPFSAAEERPGADMPVAIIGYPRWKAAGLPSSIIGQTIRINARDFTIVGVTPQGFSGTMAMAAPEVWLPLGVFETVVTDMFKSKGTGLNDRSNEALIVAGRLKPGVEIDAANTRLDALSLQLEQAYPAENRGQVMSVNPLPRMATSTSPRDDAGPIAGMTALLMGMSGVVMLIACLNLANMMLARGSARRREIAIRLAIGGTRARVVRQLLTEGVVLAIGGAAAGLLIGYWAMGALKASLGTVLPLALEFETTPDIRVLAVTAVVAALSTVLFGLGPALKFSKPSLVADLRQTSGEDVGRVLGRRFGTRNLLIVGQLALSLTLLTAAGLFARGALKAAVADPGFSFDRELLVSIDSSIAGYDEARGRALQQSVIERVRALPGVEAAALTSMVPFGDFHEGESVERVGAPVPPEGSRRSATYMIVGTDYFKALGLQMRRGREFTASEETSSSAPSVAIISEPLADLLFNGENPVGQQIRLAIRPDSMGGSRDGEPMVVVGVAPGLRFEMFDTAPVPHVYVPIGRNARAGVHLHVRAAAPGQEAALLSTIRREIQAIDTRLPILELTTMEHFRDRSLPMWAVRAGARTFTVFGVLALALAVVGVYAVKSYVVARRTREIGIRMALGARPADVLWMVLRENIWVTTAGVGLGLVLAVGVGQVLSFLLFQVSPLDPVVFAVAPLVLALAASAACYLPARRATQVSPLTAFRAE